MKCTLEQRPQDPGGDSIVEHLTRKLPVAAREESREISQVKKLMSWQAQQNSNDASHGLLFTCWVSVLI